ncbi:pyridine nucleotide-disulfide oxidoreductase/dicluster-binding protein [Desulfovibrio aminophilus]|uniref:pyridine nucleotide-disulfide oxidoreductase/dicluster-binding protein n=1 Tax=Desulfovibrio aminophilus TaxID=81425 RepID=UPI003390EBA0
MEQQELRAWEQRCIQEEMPWCQAACPLRVDVRAFLERMAKGDPAGARKLLERTMPQSGILGRLCEHPCEAVCKRAEAGGALSVGGLERACVNAVPPGSKPTVLPARGKRAAVLGGGLAALVCAWDLLRKGYGVTFLVSGDRLGGRLRDLPEARLPAGVLEEEIARVLALKPEIRAGQSLDAALLDQALSEFAAVFADLSETPDLAPDDRAAVDPVTLAGDRPGLFLGGFSTANGDVRFIDQAADGRRAASSMDRHMSGVSLTASRDKEGPGETRLFTNIAGITPQPRVIPAVSDGGYSPEEAVLEASRCLNCQCLDCVRACAFLERHKGYPKKYARQVYNNAAIVKGLHEANSLINSCSLCGLCAEICPEGFAMADLCLEARRDMVARGKMPPSAHEFALEDMAFSNGPDFALALPGPDGACAHVFFPGCQLAASHPHHVRSVFEHLRATLSGGVGLMLRCCGIPAHWAGREDLFVEAQAEFHSQWEALGRPRIVAACSSCLDILRRRSPDLPAVSLWEVLAETGLPETRGTPPPGAPLAVHDPCSTRHDETARAAVRGLLDRCGVAREELPLSGRLTECCGYGGLMSNAAPDLAREVVARRAALSPLDYVASCAMCRDRLAAEGKRAYHVLDFIFPGGPDDPATAPAPGFSARHAARTRLKRDLIREYLGREEAAAPGPKLLLAPDVLARMEERHILEEDARRAVAHAEAGGGMFREADGRRFLVPHRPRRVTYWLEYAREGDSFRVLGTWSHRMDTRLGAGAAGLKVDQTYTPDSGQWSCGHGPLEPRPVEATYLGSSFNISLLACPECGLCLVPESLALGRMAEVEHLLEDK